MERVKYIFAKFLKIFLNPPAIYRSNISKKSKICSKSELNKCSIGRYSYIGYQCFLVNVEIGSFCSIADRCSIGGATHHMNFVSTSPVFHKGKNIFKKNFALHEMNNTPVTRIENDVWIGQGVYIKAGVSIETGAVVGMGSVVTHSIGPYEIWAGNPARFIRKRFDDEVIDKLLDSKWWQFEDEEILQFSRSFDDPMVFIEELENNI